jgi:hypothetical protein
MKTRKLVLAGTLVAVLVNALLLTACIGATNTERRLLWSGTSRANEMAYRYTTFTGTVRGKVRVEAGETLVLAYAATVPKGILAVRVQTPSKATLWETTLAESVDERQVELTPAEAGNCTILVTGKEAGGDFAVSWSVR